MKSEVRLHQHNVPRVDPFISNRNLHLALLDCELRIGAPSVVTALNMFVPRRLAVREISVLKRELFRQRKLSHIVVRQAAKHDIIQQYSAFVSAQ
ncbi:hypothetical protein D3C84_991930 [compost metagenome]